MRIIENLVFKGGGVLGTAYVGAFNALQEYMLAGKQDNRPLGNVIRTAGTSAGSIFSAMISLGLSAEEVANEQAEMNYATFVDIDPDFIAHEGLCYGNSFLNWMKRLVKKYIGDKSSNTDPTFNDLYKLHQTDNTYKDLHVYSYNADQNRLYEFSYQTTPDVPIAEAVRASMSIPFFFQPWKFSGDLAEKYPGKFIDGGVFYNYPITTFDSDGTNLRTMGFYLDNMSFGNESIVRLLVHCLLYIFHCSEKFKTITEGILDTLKALKELEQTNENSFEKLSRAMSGKELDLGGAEEHLLKLIDNDMPLEHKVDLVASLAKDIPHLAGFFTTLKDYGQIIAASIHLPYNLRFENDAQRTVFVDNLGYSFADFWMPQSNKNNLINSGYKCTSQYLQYMLY